MTSSGRQRQNSFFAQTLHMTKMCFITLSLWGVQLWPPYTLFTENNLCNTGNLFSDLGKRSSPFYFWDRTRGKTGTSSAYLGHTDISWNHGRNAGCPDHGSAIRSVVLIRLMIMVVLSPALVARTGLRSRDTAVLLNLVRNKIHVFPEKGVKGLELGLLVDTF